MNLQTDPLYSHSGCLYSEIDKCIECGCEIYHSNESNDPDFCKVCFTMNHIVALMRRKKIELFGQFGEFADFIRELLKPPDYESFKIQRS